MGPVTIHSAHPFLPPPPEQRDQLRRFRGAGWRPPVTVVDHRGRAYPRGWTLSSVLVADGGPERPARCSVCSTRTPTWPMR